MTRKRLTTALDLLGVALLVAFAFFVWPPAALAVGAVGCFAASYAVVSGRA